MSACCSEFLRCLKISYDKNYTFWLIVWRTKSSRPQKNREIPHLMNIFSTNITNSIGWNVYTQSVIRKHVQHKIYSFQDSWFVLSHSPSDGMYSTNKNKKATANSNQQQKKKCPKWSANDQQKSCIVCWAMWEYFSTDASQIQYLYTFFLSKIWQNFSAIATKITKPNWITNNSG